MAQAPPQSSNDTFQGIRKVLWITMVLNLIPTFVKLAVGYLTNSLSIIADGFDSVFDAASNVVGLVGIWIAAKPISEKYPYGRRKAETVTALIIAYLLFLTTWELVKSALDRLLNPALIDAEVNVLSFLALATSIVIHMYVVHYELNAGKSLHSDILVADAQHTRADVLVSVAVAGGLVFIILGVPVADPILAIVVAAMIARIGISIIRESVPTLIDKEVLPVEKVVKIALSVPGIRSVHNVRSRGHEQAVYADLHIRVDPGMSTERAHAIAHEVGRRLREFESDLKDVTIHVEPDGSSTHNTSQEALAIPLRRIAMGLGASMHDVWAHIVNGQYYVETHVELDGSLPLRYAHEIITKIEERARAEIPNLKTITTHIEPAGLLTSVDKTTQKDEDLKNDIMKTVQEIDIIRTCHDVQIHRDEGRLVLSLHINLSGDIPLTDAHQITLRLETRLREKIPGLSRVIIHAEPIS
nr:cation-efflux pump [Candidatus Sigynarchaeota archaeon]